MKEEGSDTKRGFCFITFFAMVEWKQRGVDGEISVTELMEVFYD